MINEDNTNLTSMVNYIREDLFEKFKKDREPLEIKWQRNLDAFNCVTTGKFWKAKESEDWRSKTFVQITKIKTMAAWSLVVDMMLQANKIPFNLVPSPWDEVQFEDLQPEERQRAEEDIEDQVSLIDQQFVDSNADRALMKNVMAAAMMGETIAKTYIYEVTRTGFKQVSFAPEGMEDQQGQYSRFEEFKTSHNAPGWGYVSNWNIFRDLETDDLQAGVGIIERDYVSPYQLAKKKGGEYWIDEAIDKVIKTADKPGGVTRLKETKSLPPGMRDIKHRHKTIEMLEGWCRVPEKIVEQFISDIGKEDKDKEDKGFDFEFEHDGKEIECLVVVCDNEVVRFAKREEGTRPYDRAVWEDSLDTNVGHGVPDNLEEVQTVLNGMVRAFEDNKKLSANVLLAVKNRLLTDWDGVIASGRIPVSEEADSVREAIEQITIQDVGESLLSGIALFERYGDEASMLPRIMQGTIAEKQKPDTLGELSMLQQNAGKYLGGVLKNFDEGLIEPKVTAFYKYNMADPEIQKGKGNFIAKATGFSSFQNRIIRVQKIMQAINIGLSHDALASEVKFRTLLEEVYKTLDIETQTALKTPQEKQEESAAKEQAMQQVMQQERMKIMDEADTQLKAKIDEINAEHQNELELLEEKHKNDVDLLLMEQDHDIDMKAADVVSQKMNPSKPAPKPVQKQAAA